MKTWFRIVAGAGAASVYVAIAFITASGGRLPIRPLYDGFVPAGPYRWVNPPPSAPTDSLPPETGEGEVQFEPQGSSPVVLQTGDNQVLLNFPQGAVQLRENENAIRVEITPLDPATLAPAPKGFDYDSNAYRVTGSYSISGEPAVLAASSCSEPGEGPRCPLLILRYVLGAEHIYRLSGSEWERVEAPVLVDQSMEILADIGVLGTYVAVAPRPTPAGPPIQTYLALFLATAALALAVGLTRRMWLRRAAPHRESGADKE